jgi:hypothetical protein
LLDNNRREKKEHYYFFLHCFILLRFGVEFAVSGIKLADIFKKFNHTLFSNFDYESGIIKFSRNHPNCAEQQSN